MCRIAIKSNKNQVFDPKAHLELFSHISKNSKEFQGHGWGTTYKLPEDLQTNSHSTFSTYKNIKPIWQDKESWDSLPQTPLIIVHARSAFEDKGIIIENNMPFEDENFSFIFNGELRGVKIREEGRIGAEKIFNFIKKFIKLKKDTKLGFETALKLIKIKTEFIRGLNIILLEKNTNKLFVTNNFNDKEPDYYQMYERTVPFKDSTMTIISSDPYNFKQEGWTKLETGKVIEF